ncbi:precorrin-6y C5,15-methyltransferase (decarboxylating) subunit CbiE [Streptomyces sp. A7024]|uniref:Precorrin-6y C5,15-methyltransferase (Decarboxylating) subunit CbiE n=1 Tax=Streptomyces coryli TaxID=1128680 RepID=A0A6G4U8A1_9ACTN|nr:precorrin-6y C5,15-methyltransferase (decarboxylating) subunit CbiE [Streptomyces coryli]
MIKVIGVGTGAPPPRVAEAALVVGAKRHLEAAELPAGAERVVLGALEPALERIAEVADGTVVVLASGDPGFFGIVRVLAARFGPAALDVHPSTPSIAQAFARAGLPWDDAAVVSAHGRALRTAVNVCRAHPKTAVLTGPGAGPAEIGAALSGLPRTLLVAHALGTPAEEVVRLSPAEAATRSWPEAVSVVISLDESRALAATPRTIAGASVAPAQWALPEADFDHRDSMITKFEVRALALSRLAPRLGDLVWDLGAGSGSVAIECARLGAAAIAVEKSADGAERIRANAAAHGVCVQTVHGTAPAALTGLPDPDAVFVGGGGAELAAVTKAAAHRARRAVVVTLAALDRVPAVQAELAAAGLAVDGVLLQSSRLAPLPGEVTRLAATNPVFVLWGLRPEALSGAPQ